jgi:hypothetical protein
MLLARVHMLTQKPVFRFFVFLSIWGICNAAYAQEANVPLQLPLEYSQTVLFERQLLEVEDRWVHGAVKPRTALASYRALQQDSLYQHSAKANLWWYKRLFATHLLEAQQAQQWGITADFLLDLQVGRSFIEGKNTWLNTRGARIQGFIGSKIAFGTELYENQAVVAGYVDSLIVINGVMPGQGLATPFGRGWSYVNAQSYIAYQVHELVKLEVGQGRQFVGHGYRSLLLSDVAFPAPYFRWQAELGPVQYTYWVQQLIDINAPMLHWTLGYRQKYSAMSYLNFKPHKRLELGLYQALVWQAEDGNGNRRGAPWQYLNPIIFWHPIQYSSGSEGNLLLGLNAQFRLRKQAFLYGQLMLDELRVADFLKQNGAATNKYGLQAGWKSYRAFGLPNLFAQVEANLVRPYVYSHWTTLSSYMHYGQSMAHPAGANFAELLAHADYRLARGWLVQARLLYREQGLDSAGINFGADPRQSYVTAPGGFNSYGVWMFQGQRAQLLHAELLLGKLLNPKTNLQIEVRCILRQLETGGTSQQTLWFMLGVRSALRNLYSDF